MTVAELGVRMSNREYAEQMIYDKLVKEAHQEIALDRQFAADHAKLVRSVS